MKKLFAAAVGLLFLVAGSTAAPTLAQGEGGEGPSLYDRLGGVYPIALVVDDFIDRVVADETINANPVVGAARKPERLPGLKHQLTAMVCQATGGPCAYTGKSMKEAHQGMNITEGEWAALGALFKASLDKFGVPEAEQQELFAIVESTKGDIVVAAAE